MLLAEKIVLSALTLVLIVGAGGFVWLIVAPPSDDTDTVQLSVTTVPEPEDWRELYPKTVPINIGGVDVLASVADTIPDRIKGLSGTPYLPDGLVKLFAFHAEGKHSIWMKDMNYSLDILWLAENGEIVHIEENVSPDTYPQSFSSPVPAWYVIEANAGFVASSSIQVGDLVAL